MAYYQIGQTSGTLASAETVFGHDPKSTYAPGGAMVRTASGSIDIVGYARSVWQFAAMDVSTFDSAKTALFSDDGTYSGEGYVETRDDNDDNVASDCVINFPDPRNLRRWGGKYLDVTIEIILLDAGSPIPWGGGALASYATETFVTNAIATHALDNDAHHDPITLASDIDTNLLSLSTQELGLDAQSANEIFAGPTTGGDAKPTFRALVAADLPAATTSAQGAVELATNAEAQAGASTTVAVTPAALRADIPATPAASRGVRLDASGYLNMPNGGRVVTDAVYARDSDGLKLYEDGGKGIFVQDSTGYAGFLIADPQSPLHVSGSNGNEIARFSVPANSGSVQGEGYIGLCYFENENESYSPVRIGVLERNEGSFDGSMLLQTRDSGADDEPETRVTIQYDGKVGFLTTNPDAEVDINGALALQDMSAPSAVAGHTLFYSVSGEGYVKDDSGNATQLSPHNFSLLGGPSEDMAWSYYSERDGVAVNVDMMRVVREVEKLSNQSLVAIEELS